MTGLDAAAGPDDVSQLPRFRPAKSGPDETADMVARGGKGAAASRHLSRPGVRFIVFNAVGGTVFLAGVGLQALLTGRWHLLPVMSYLIQAVASVEASFLLNRWLTWRDRGTAFWPACARFNTQKAVTVALNLALYAGLIRLGMNYLAANVLLTAVFTVVSYVASDHLVFVPRKEQAQAVALAPPLAPLLNPPTAPPPSVRDRSLPTVSVVIPCRDSERTIRAAVQSLLDQDYPRLHEIILVGSSGDPTWTALAGIADPRLILTEQETPPGVRDANIKRDAGIAMTSGELIALIDSDVVLPSHWMTGAVAALEDSDVSCVAGGMRSIHDTFWGRYTDGTVIGAKTPRIAQSYMVTNGNFGRRGRKPPITANAIFTRDLYKQCPIDAGWSHGSYEDYEWFWRVARAGYEILVCTDLFAWHHHRRGVRSIARDYLRSSRGCAHFIRAHLDSPLAQRRLRQAVTLPLAAAAGAIAAAVAAAEGHGAQLAVVVLACVAAPTVHQIVRSRRLESLVYPAAGLAFGLVFTIGLVTSLVTSLIRHGSRQRVRQEAPETPALPDVPSAHDRHGAPGRPVPRRFLLHPLTAICAIQAALSCTLIWSNTVFVDEANYLWAGHLDLARWLHGAPVPQYLLHFSGSPVIYPPLGALADNIGGLAGARILSLIFMLGATVLLYLTAARLTGRAAAVFAAGLWALSEPVLRLAFATYDPLSILLTALSAWLAVEAGYRRRRGELVAASAAALALANATAYSGIVIDPAVIAFAFLAWLPRMGARQASYCTAWLAGGGVVILGLVMTATHSWSGTGAVFHRTSPDRQSPVLVLNDIWTYGGLIIVIAVIGAVVALGAENRRRAAMLALLGGTIFVVPAAQLHAQTSWSLDKHLAYGTWFAAIAAGYGCSKLTRWLPGASRGLLALCCAAALAYPAANSWELSWNMYHSWPDARSFVAVFTSIVARSHGLIDVSGQQSVAEYYTPQGREWRRWDDLLFHSAQLRPGAREHYFAAQLGGGKYGVIALFYATSISSGADLPGSSLLSPHSSRTYQKLLGLAGVSTTEPDLPVLTQALESNPEYRLVAVGPYDTSSLWGTHDNGVYAIWQKKAQQKKAKQKKAQK